MPFATLAGAACAAGLMANASCSSDGERASAPLLVDGSSPREDAAAGDAAIPAEDADAADASSKDAAPFEGKPLEVECDSPTCAVALVSVRDEGFCALLRDGTVVCWGQNDDGQLGRGDTSSDNATPARVLGLSGIVSLDHTCAIDGAGAAWCWGSGPFLQNSSVTTEPVPVKLDLPPVAKLSAYKETACAVTDSGVLCWGSNASGQVAFDEPFAATPIHPPLAIAREGGTPIRHLVVNEATFLVHDDGMTESWGANALLVRASSISPDPIPLPIPLEHVGWIDAAENHACAAVEGAAVCWGTDIGWDPVWVVPPEPIVQIATTKAVYDGNVVTKPARWCGAALSGAVYCQGYNAAGQAGDGTTNYALRPVEVEGIPDRAAQVRTTNDATCVLSTKGDVYCFGNDYDGQLGNGVMRRSSLVPVKVSMP